jgi:sugar/nucleoside kinase (ribokinase family)
MVLPWGEKLGVDDVYFTIGGNAANAGVTFARQGFKTACAAKIGKDLPAREFLAHLKREGVAVKLIKQTGEKPTAYSALLLRDGERTILSYHGASDTFTLDDLPLAKLRARWWYLSLAGESDAMFLPLLKFAKENGIKVAFNPSGHHLKHKRREILDCLKDLAVLVLNAGEAAELVGIPFERAEAVFKKLDELTPRIAVVTDGPRGVTVSDGQNLYKAGIFKEKEVADRTGAGDSFGSGFTAALMRRERVRSLNNIEDIKYAIRLATANAASVVEHIGATEGILTREEFEKNPRWRNLDIKVAKL